MTDRDVIRFFDSVVRPGEVTELRILNVNGRNFSGYFDDIQKLICSAQQFSGRASGIYFSLNTVEPSLLSRANNRVIAAKNTTGDADIVRRRTFAIDFDPVRKAGIPSTEGEHEYALECSVQVKNWLSDRGWPAPFRIDTGNGAALIYAIDLPADELTTEIYRNALLALAVRFSNGKVEIDTSVFNLARIWRVPGTINKKGDSTPERPHRTAILLEIPSDVQPATPAQIAELAALVPDISADGAAGSKNPRSTARNKALVNRFIQKHGLHVAKETDWKQGGYRWILAACPFNPDHDNNACAAIFLLPTGAIGFSCKHNGCQDKDWSSLRDMFEPDGASGGPDETTEERKSQVKRLLELSIDAELFHSPDREAYATVPIGGHHETYRVRGNDFSLWLRKLYYEDTGSGPRLQALQDAKAQLESRALFDGPETNIHVRIAELNGKMYLDLCDPESTVVEIDSTGWRIIEKSPVKFCRYPGMLHLPTPERGGHIDELRKFLNVGSQADYVLILAWLSATFRARGPYPILALHGEQGSAKSTTARLLRSLIDPNAASLRAEFRELRDLMIAARNSWVISMDNLSSIPVWLSDALCRLATGGGFGTRELYSDTAEILFDAQRPCILNGIEELASRGDLLDRSLIVYLPAIPEERRKTEAEFWADFRTAHPRILGALLDIVVAAARSLPSTHLPCKPRLADFALWAKAAESAFGWPEGTFIEAYTSNRRSANELALEASPIVQPICALVANRDWQGTATELLHALTDLIDDKQQKQRGWPTNAARLSNCLRRVVPNLRSMGIEVEFLRDTSRSRSRKISIQGTKYRSHKTPADTHSDANHGSRSSAAFPQAVGVSAITRTADTSDESDDNVSCVL